MKKQNNSRVLNRYLLLPNLYQIRLIFFLIILFLFGITSPISSAALDVREAIVKVYTVSNSPDYYNPWSMRGPQGVSGSGCIIENNLILTNAMW